MFPSGPGIVCHILTLGNMTLHTSTCKGWVPENVNFLKSYRPADIFGTKKNLEKKLFS